MSTLRQMRERELKPDNIAYLAGVTACEKVGRWQQALSWFDTAQEEDVHPDAFYCRSGAAAWEGAENKAALIMLGWL